ncbi:spermatogenesis-associated protein 17-like [Hydractinia symbiolongicarpus]|uniref:spermatogenesis-associated protein 17-like n=1 Tax=Hydractinia symbiolongicarpus TaxID=13093 RepID=UPI00254EE9E0|nr:spermatogenesis-associated protein 17-like [Hydractinia symbiolongicarpus]
MALLYCLLQKEQSNLAELFNMFKASDSARLQERSSTIKIQSWFRSIRVQKYIRYLHRCATIIQKTYRGYVGRSLYREIVQNKMNLMRKHYYDVMATKIQARWRGFYIRKYKFDFYARKRYLNALVCKNEIFRQQVKEIQKMNELEEEAKRIDNQMAAATFVNRKTHYLLSTNVCPGIYNSPNEKSLDKEFALRNSQPFSKNERRKLQRDMQLKYIKTSTGIPRAEETGKDVNVCILPPVATQKPQGPFRSPEEVQKQRYKRLEPSLRVATEHQSVEKARTLLRQEEWTKRIIDKSFLPSTKTNYPYVPALDSSTFYGRVDYGTKHFREDVPEKQIHAKSFQRVVSPIPIFEQLGKTY